ncbi:CGNR zinc finger domain-containing protein [Actinomadura sp. NPDC048955]|uniref:CGNR zinc finger domain-containing protein n=1 Tax=Actinomadura sp. NPDC048955 TaxID=3158228 RepID=UPI0033F0954A
MPELPRSIRPLVAFLNTVNVEEGTDVFDDGPAALADWLVEQGLFSSLPVVTASSLQAAIDLRRGLRSLALANTGERPDLDDVWAAQVVLASLTFTIHLPTDANSTRTGPVLATDNGGSISSPLGQIAAAYFTASVRGEWSRVRRCPAHDCAWVFWDTSKNASRRWCSMRVCGNRAKVRAFTERQGTRPAGYPP